MKRAKKWVVYIIECGDGTLYCGCTNDIDARMKKHSSGDGAKYTRAKGFKKLLYTESKRTRSTAQKREAEIKKLTRSEKLALIRDQ